MLGYNFHDKNSVRTRVDSAVGTGISSSLIKEKKRGKLLAFIILMERTLTTIRLIIPVVTVLRLALESAENSSNLYGQQ